MDAIDTRLRKLRHARTPRMGSTHSMHRPLTLLDARNATRDEPDHCELAHSCTCTITRGTQSTICINVTDKPFWAVFHCPARWQYFETLAKTNRNLLPRSTSFPAASHRPIASVAGASIPPHRTQTVMFRNQYDTDITTFSPAGRLHQVSARDFSEVHAADERRTHLTLGGLSRRV
jgi:hypothetical protein